MCDHNAVQSFWTRSHDAPGRWVCREWSVQPTSPRHRALMCTFEEVFKVAFG
uniref:Uncharacterized protein n=1 Tax=Aromatoleum buckelii TaxID=200254 RepID=A0ABX1N7C8_9RHOO